MHGHKLTGDASRDVVALQNPGGMLYPLEDQEQYESLRGSSGEAVPQTAAAFVPASMTCLGVAAMEARERIASKERVR